MITGYMSSSYETKKYGADKIALLGLLIVSFVIARFIIVSRSAVVLSEPIVLEYAGLSVSVPVGNGWRSEKQWKYQDNSFTLSSYFDTGSGVAALAHCRYILTAVDASADVIFGKKASAVGGVIAKTGQTQAGKFTIDWAHIQKQEILFDTFFGTVRLPNNRQFDIEVFQNTGDSDLAEPVFERIVESLEFEDNKLLEAGSEVIAEIKSKGIRSFSPYLLAKEAQGVANLDDQTKEEFFLIRDSESGAIGFAMDLLGLRFANRSVFLENQQSYAPESLEAEVSLTDLSSDAQLEIHTVSFYYIRGRHQREQAAFFQSSDNLDEFIWKSEISGMAGRRGTEIALDKFGQMTVKSLGPPDKQSNYRVAPAMVPDVLSELIFSQMLDSYHKKIFVDIIEAEGTIMPTRISRIEAEEDGSLEAFYKTAAEQNFPYVFKVEFLNGRGFSQQVYLDNQRQISKILLRQERPYLLERTSLKDMVGQFPERADYILEILERNKFSQQYRQQKNNQ